MIKHIISLSFIFLLILLISCEEIPTEIIDIQTEDYVVTKITAPDVVTFSDAVVNKIWFDISSLDGSTELTTLNTMVDDGNNGDTKKNDNIFTGKVKLDENLLSGKFEITYYIEDIIRIKPNNIKKVGSRIFTYQSKAENVAPNISKLNILDIITRGDKFSFSVVVSDSNGLNDIALVYYVLKDPSGKVIKNSQGISEFPLYDDGALNHSDDVAGDGIFTTNLTFPTSAAIGDWEFTFVAKDKGGLFSNTITHKVNVK